jgi:hypothetical protein
LDTQAPISIRASEPPGGDGRTDGRTDGGGNRQGQAALPACLPACTREQTPPREGEARNWEAPARSDLSAGEDGEIEGEATGTGTGLTCAERSEARRGEAAKGRGTATGVEWTGTGRGISLSPRLLLPSFLRGAAAERGGEQRCGCGCGLRCLQLLQVGLLRISIIIIIISWAGRLILVPLFVNGGREWGGGGLFRREY